MEMNPLTLFIVAQYITYIAWNAREITTLKERIKALETKADNIKEDIANIEKRIDKLFSITTEIKVNLERKQH